MGYWPHTPSPYNQPKPNKQNQQNLPALIQLTVAGGVSRGGGGVSLLTTLIAVDQSSLVGATGLPPFLQGFLEHIPIPPVAGVARRPPQVNQNLCSSQT